MVFFSKRFLNSNTKPLLKQVKKCINTFPGDNLQTYHCLFLSLYSEFFPIPEQIPDHDFVYTDSIYDNVLNHAEDEESRQKYIEQKEEYEGLNGLLLQPCEFDKKFYLLISKKRITLSADFGKTLCHELTHMFDFHAYMQRYTLLGLRDIPNIDDYFAYWFISEFRARCRSFIVFFNFIKLTSEIKFSNIVDSLYEYGKNAVDEIIEKLQEHEYVKARYVLAQYLGQIHAINVFFKKKIDFDARLYQHNLKSLCDMVIKCLNCDNYFPMVPQIMNEINNIHQ